MKTIASHRAPRRSKLTPLAAALVVALGLGAADTQATTRTVLNCDDSGSGSLREAMQLSQDTDTVSLNSLVCSTITLITAALPAANRLLIDASQRQAPVVIDGGRYSGRHDRVIVHNGVNGHLYLNNVGVTNGDYSGMDPRGGCILSTGSVSMVLGRVDHCRVSGAGIAAKGGGIYAAGTVAPYEGTIVSNNVASATGANAYGGGIFAASFNSLFASITGNSATSDVVARGGGVYAFEVLVQGTTLSGNHAGSGGALVLRPDANPFAPRLIVNSTISGNTAINNVGGVLSYGSLYVSNSTIAFNSSAFGPVGLYVDGPSNFLQLDSSIVAVNSTSGGVIFDVAAVGTFNGANNLVTSGPGVPVGTLSSCPRLGRLADNGFRTLTHALLPGSPALDVGSKASGGINDQRQMPRPAGTGPDIGALEVQPGEKFDDIFRSGVDNRCG